LKGGRLIFWVMDLNPDEAIAAGWLKPNSFTSKVLSTLLNRSMRHSDKIIALDRLAKQRIVAKGIAEDKIEIISPWSHDDSVHFDQRGREAFRAAHGWSKKYVVMYAGNHSPCHPLDTLLEAALKLKGREEIIFCFVGGGSEQSKVREFSHTNTLKNILCLPYQPLPELSAVLSAADLHVVVMGEAFTGIVHPSKIYNILAVASPFLYIGPELSHITDIVARLDDRKLAKIARHGDVELVRKHVGECADANRQASSRRPLPLAKQFSKDVVLPKLLDVIELGVAGSEVLSPAAPAPKVQSA